MTAGEETEIHLDTLRRARRALREDCGVTLLGVVGSFARGEQTSGSDVDVVYRRTKGRVVTLLDVSRAGRRLEARLGRPVDMIDWAAVRDNRREGMARDLVRLDAGYAEWTPEWTGAPGAASATCATMPGKPSTSWAI